MPSPQSDIYFFHVPKTAGSSLSLMLRELYHPSECCPAQTVRELVNMNADHVPGFRCYTGHLFTLLQPLARREIPTVTILRDPFEQTMSLIRHCQRIDFIAGLRPPLLARGLEKTWKVWPRLRSRIEKAWCPVVMNNFQTRVLGGDITHPGRLSSTYSGLTYPFLSPDFCSPHLNMDQLLANAKERLQRMAVVGTVERYAETIEAIFAFLQAPLPSTMPWVNSGRSATNRKIKWRDSGMVCKEFAALIERQNEYDYELYRFAGELLEKQQT